MKNNLTKYIVLIITTLGTGIAASSQDQKKPSERSFTQEISKIKQIQADRAKVIERTKTQTAEKATVVQSKSANNEKQNPIKVESAQAAKPSSGEMRKPQKPVSSKG